LFAGRYEFVGDYAIDYPPPSHNRDVARARWYGVELRLSREEAGRHRFDVGVEVQRTDALEQTNFDLQPEPYTYLDDRRDAWRVSAYAEDRVRLASHWSSHLGLRADRASGRRAELSPRLALNCAINDRLDVKLIYGRSYRPPNAFQAYYEVNGPGGYERNPDLRPEAVHGEELAVDWRPRPRWRLSGSLFYSSTHDLMQLGSIADGTMYRFENVGRLSARGAEVELEFVGNATHLRANYTLARTDADTGLGNLKHFPRQMLKAVAFTELRTAWTLAAEAAAVSARGAAPGYAVANLNLGWQARETGPRASCGLFNVFDRKIYDPGSDPVAQPITSQSGRVWRVELSWPVTF
jgi:iron complex outermembrane receptor protein